MELLKYISKSKLQSAIYMGILAVCLTISSGCRKFIEIDTPPTSSSTESAFKNDLTAAAILTGIYSRFSSEFNAPTIYGAGYYTELSADNLEMFDINAVGPARNFYRHTVDPNSYTYWETTYSIIYTLNISIDELSASEELTPDVKSRLLGEAYFMRAFCYFYLVNFYGDVPLVLTPKYTVTAALSRANAKAVYDQINKDLATAEDFMDFTYVGSDVSKLTVNRLRPNLAAVNALQARAFLYQSKYAEAEAAATKVINQTSLYSLAEPASSFVKNSSETIWALQPVTIGFNTREAQIYLLPETGPDDDFPVFLSAHLMNVFEAGDARKEEWTKVVSVIDASNNTKIYPYAAKYKYGRNPGSNEIVEYSIVLRLAEQYLIRAEARNEQGNSSGATQDLNLLRKKRRLTPSATVSDPLPDIPATLTKAQLSRTILHERQVELFTEWGHRWFDLKRTGKIDEVMTPVSQERGVAWSGYQALYPIPIPDIMLNRALTQNSGYPN